MLPKPQLTASSRSTVPDFPKVQVVLTSFLIRECIIWNLSSEWWNGLQWWNFYIHGIFYLEEKFSYLHITNISLYIVLYILLLYLIYIFSYFYTLILSIYLSYLLTGIFLIVNSTTNSYSFIIGLFFHIYILFLSLDFIQVHCVNLILFLLFVFSVNFSSLSLNHQFKYEWNI